MMLLGVAILLLGVCYGVGSCCNGVARWLVVAMVFG